MKVTSSCELQGPTANRAAANLRATYSMLLCLIPFSLYSCSNFRWLFSSCRFRSAFLPLLLPLLLRLNVASAGVAQYFDNYNRMLTTGLGGYPGYFSRSDLGVGLDITLVSAHCPVACMVACHGRRPPVKQRDVVRRASRLKSQQSRSCVDSGEPSPSKTPDAVFCTLHGKVTCWLV